MMSSLIIVPTFNEVENISSLLKAVYKVLPMTHVLVVDDSSPDGTADHVRLQMKQYPKQLFLSIREKKEGLGKAYIHGFKWALKHDYEYIFEMDADLSHPADSLPSLLKQLSENDVVIGSRYLEGLRVKNWPLTRVLLSRMASIYVKSITKMPVEDPTAGFVGYTRKSLESLNFSQIKFVGYAFQIEMKYKLWKKGFRILEIPITFTNRGKGVSKMNSSIIWEAIYAVIYLKFKTHN